jgi:hypothetical protein
MTSHASRVSAIAGVATVHAICLRGPNMVPRSIDSTPPRHVTHSHFLFLYVLPSTFYGIRQLYRLPIPDYSKRESRAFLNPTITQLTTGMHRRQRTIRNQQISPRPGYRESHVGLHNHNVRLSLCPTPHCLPCEGTAPPAHLHIRPEPELHELENGLGHTGCQDGLRLLEERSGSGETERGISEPAAENWGGAADTTIECESKVGYTVE